ncbi:MAG: biotin/lipoyl-containing protein [Salinivirgaceae bacterium]
MAMEVQLDERLAKVELLAEDGNIITIKVDDKVYQLDMIQVEQGVYSVLYNGLSYNVELIATDSPKKYAINTFYHSYQAEIIDAETRYQRARSAGNEFEAESTLVSPMPGKVVKIPVKPGDKVQKGETVIIIAAMKMESEYKAMKDGVITDIYVKEDQTIDGNQPLLKIE